MRAVVISRFGEADVLEPREVGGPEPGPEEILIENRVVGVNFADVMARRGRYDVGVEPPFVPGMEIAGTVVAVGSAVESIREGDLVTAFSRRGGYAERTIASQRLAWRVPHEVDLEQAVAVPLAGVTAYNLLTLAGGLAPGESVLVHTAAGGVGTIAVQIARALGAREIIGTVGNQEKVAVARAAGCDHVIVRGQEDLAKKTRALTGGTGVDLALDPISGPLFGSTLACVSDFGRVVVFGMAGGSPGTVTTDLLHSRNRSVIGYSTGGHVREHPDPLYPAGEAVLGLLRNDEIEIVVGPNPIGRPNPCRR